MTEKEIFDKLCLIIWDYLGEKIDIKEDDLLVTDLNFTSLDLMSIIGEVEDRFQFTFIDEDMQHIKTVKEVVEYIKGRIDDKESL